MKTKFIRLLAIFAIVGMAFTGCQEDNGVAPKGKEQQNVVTHGLQDKYAIIDGEQPTYKLQVKESFKKGVYGSHDNPALIPWYIEADTVFVEGSSKKYIAMKVKRSDALGDYFYIMIRNLSIKGFHQGKYKAYNNDYNYAEEYGYLYDLEEANYLSNMVYMKLPIVYNGVEYPDKARCDAKLPSKEDFECIFRPSDSNEEGNLTSYSPELKYYDAFIGGLSSNNEDEYTMTGHSDNMNFPEHFFNKGGMHFWTSETYSDNDCYPIRILRSYYGEIHNYSANMSVLYDHRYGNGVRYVFYPPVY